MFLLDDILLAPIKGLLWLGENIKKAVEKELGDESTLKEKLMELQFKYELGDVGEGQFKQQEDFLLKRLDAISKMKGNKEER
jgi:hypothetical protein